MRTLAVLCFFLVSMCNLALADDASRAAIVSQCPRARDNLVALNNQLHEGADDLIHTKSRNLIIKECEFLKEYQISLQRNIDDWRLCEKQGATHIEEVIGDVSLMGDKANKIGAIFCH